MKPNSTFFKSVVTQSSCFSDLTKTWPPFPICPEILPPTCCAENHAGIENTIFQWRVLVSNDGLNAISGALSLWKEEFWYKLEILFCALVIKQSNLQQVWWTLNVVLAQHNGYQQFQYRTAGIALWMCFWELPTLRKYAHVCDRV